MGIRIRGAVFGDLEGEGRELDYEGVWAGSEAEADGG